MSFVPDSDRSIFENLCKGVHDFNESELARIRSAAEEVRAVMQSANDRQQKQMSAGASS